MGRNARTRYCVLLMVFRLCAPSAETYSIVDVQKVPAAGDPMRAVVRITVPDHVDEITCDFLIAGAGMGGIAGALVAAGSGHSVCLTEETDWVGGQATAGGVSALDENHFIEFAGGTRSYMDFRNRIRNWYREHAQLTPQAARLENFNPGSCYVSPLCFEPTVGAAVLDAMLAEQPKIHVYRRTAIIALERHGKVIGSALAWQFDTQRVLRFRPRFVLDATEMGDLLPLAKIPYVIGAESKAETAEPDAPVEPNKACVQSFTYPFILEHETRSGPLAEKPPGYNAIVHRQGFSLTVNYPVEFGWAGKVRYQMFGNDPPIPNNMSPGPFFSWRRVLDKTNFSSGVRNDLALINWPRQDYGVESPLDRDPAALAGILQRAKQTSLAFLYWLQHDVPREQGGGNGYPELRLRQDEMGSGDGLSKYPYMRESRRLLARGRVTEQDIVDEFQSGSRARTFADSIGTGFYMVDIHPCGANEHGRMRMPKPFQIPMAALLPREAVNFLPAGKSIGVTHLSNGAFRLHPVEWNIGESAAVIGSLWLESGTEPQPARVQRKLASLGVPMVWFDDLASSDPAFEAIQIAALGGIYPMSDVDLHAAPNAPLTRAEAAVAICAYFGHRLKKQEAINYVLRKGWMAADHRNWFHPDIPFYWTDWREDKFPTPLPSFEADRTGPVRRSELARRLCTK